MKIMSESKLKCEKTEADPLEWLFANEKDFDYVMSNFGSVCGP